MKCVTITIDNRLQRFKVAWAFIVGAFLNKDVTINDVPDNRITGEL